MMKKKILALAAGLLLSGALPGAARAVDGALDLSIAAYSWKEHIPEGTPKEFGPILTVGGYVSGAPLKNAPSFRLRGEAEVFLGVVNYDTFASSPSAPFSLTPASTHSGYFGFSEEIDGGRRIEGARGGVEPFLGLAYREWIREVGSTNSGSGYPENYRTLYGRIGLRADRPIREGLTLLAAASIDPMLWAEEQVDWSGISGERFIFKNGRRPGWTIELGARWRKVEGTLYWKATRFGESDKVSCLRGAATCLQPKSDQDIIGAKLGLRF